MKKVLTSFLLCLAVVFAAYIFWDSLGFYGSNGEYLVHLPTHALLTGLIFAVVYCTMIIVDKSKK
ncbi:hypothetical protein HYG86_10940 [Alkalicella caledoniensis]|uniref:DUF3955 domain-containing protein n=1 Tax=Alkalicella caledoniensis TaxID=2731377 RepID=A0A7G9W977_ALKCA|nr:hypothetical protein [Alkalicella caledoniensis]QNO15239.1 hypothetical protein HYG86_10940 [Alkalicella caledoniensis]